MTDVTPGMAVARGRSEPVDLVRVLRQTYLFSDLPPSDLELLAARVTVRELRPSEAVYRVGDRATHLFVVAAGQLKEGLTTEEGEEYIDEIFGPGGIAGEPGLFAIERDRIVDLTAMTPAVVLAIDRDDLIDFLVRHPAVLLRMVEGLASDTRAMVENIVAFGFRTVRQRVAMKLCELAAIHGELGSRNSIRFRVRVSQGILAGLVAARRENVNRAVASLRTAGLIASERDDMIILDLAGLRAVAGPDRIGHRRNHGPTDHRSAIPSVDHDDRSSHDRPARRGAR